MDDTVDDPRPPPRRIGEDKISDPTTNRVETGWGGVVGGNIRGVG